MRAILSLAALVLLLSSPGSVQAASLSAFLADVAPAYDKVRTAMFYIERGAMDPALAEIEGARDHWRSEVLPHTSRPPGAFADDSGFAATIKWVGEKLSDAANASSPDGTLGALSAISERLAELRRRNNIVIFADRVAEANRAMDRLWTYRHREIDFSDQAEVDRLRARVAVASYTYQKCQDLAPQSISSQANFRRMVKGTLASLDLMWEAIAAGDQTAVINILREVRSFDKLLWLHYG